MDRQNVDENSQASPEPPDRVEAVHKRSNRAKAAVGDTSHEIVVDKPTENNKSADRADGLALLCGQTHIRSDVRLAGRAVRERWNMPQGAFDAMPELLVRIAENDAGNDLARVSAIKTLAVMHSQNQAADRPVAPHTGVTVNVAIAHAPPQSEADREALLRVGRLLRQDKPE